MTRRQRPRARVVSLRGHRDGSRPFVTVRDGLNEGVLPTVAEYAEVSLKDRYSWGNTSPGAWRLARDLTALALGPAARCDAAPCGTSCDSCGGTRLNPPAQATVRRIRDQLVADLPWVFQRPLDPIVATIRGVFDATTP